MNRFIKKNLFLIGVMGLSALGILILLILSVAQYFEMSKYIEKTSKMQETNRALMRKRPSPVAENLELMSKDIENYTVATGNMSNYFGQPLYPALKVFADELHNSSAAALAMEMRRIDPQYKALETQVKNKSKSAADLENYLKEKFEVNAAKFEADRKAADKNLQASYDRAALFYEISHQTLTPELLQRKFREFWEAEKAVQGPREQAYRRFRASNGVAREGDKKLWQIDLWDMALEKFVVEAQKTTMEVIDERNREEIFLASLGLPRNMGLQRQRLEVFAREMQNKVVELLTEKNEINMLGVYFNAKEVPMVKNNKDFSDRGRDEKKDENSSAGTSSSSGEGSSTTAENADPADVIRHWEIVSDLAQRIVKAKINSVEELSYKDLAGREEDHSSCKCRFYTYTLSVGGGEKEIRNLLNELNNAYKDHRIYVVRRFSIKKQEDQVQDIIDVAQGILGTDKSGEAGKLAVKNEGMNPDEGQKVIAARPTYFKEEGKYPECVAGRTDMCYASIVLDYVMYSGNILK